MGQRRGALRAVLNLHRKQQPTGHVCTRNGPRAELRFRGRSDTGPAWSSDPAGFDPPDIREGQQMAEPIPLGRPNESALGQGASRAANPIGSSRSTRCTRGRLMALSASLRASASPRNPVNPIPRGRGLDDSPAAVTRS
jgi:hypothetical protein